MAVAVENGFRPPMSRPQRCKLHVQSFTQFDFTTVVDLNQNDAALSKQAFQNANFHRCFSSPCLPSTLRAAAAAEDGDNGSNHSSNPRIEIISGSRDPRARALVVEVAVAMASGINSVPISNGLGGAYYMQGRNGYYNIGVAKPIDEEPLAFNNPKGFRGLMLGQPGLKRSVRVGESGMREFAAYLLDHYNFAGVPPTALVKITNVPFYINASSPISSSPTPQRIASLQRYVDHYADAGELGSSSFSVGSVHRIGILDIRLLNLDRHAGNLLVKKHGHDNTGSVDLVPIDHGLCLPEWLDDPYFEWLNWPQASMPFSESESEYILNLEPFKDVEILRSEIPSLRESSIRVLVVCTLFLKQAAASGLYLADIGQMMTRDFSGGEENWSTLESFCLQAKSTMMELASLDEESVNFCSKEETDQVMTQFDMEIEDTSEDLDQFPQSLPPSPCLVRPPKVQRSSSLSALPESSMPPLEDKHGSSNNGGYDATELEGDGDSKKEGLLARSTSFPAQKPANDNVGVTLGDMRDDEWESFLSIFKKLLPQVIENYSNNCKGSSKQRLGTSCEF